MKKHKIIILILMSLLIISCSQGTKKTTAKLKLNMGSIATGINGVGAGGAILFGKSSTGEHFGKIISPTDLNIELANGTWSFYAVMWEKSSINNLADVVYCAKSTEKLSGTAVSISMNLTNANCADNDFSGGTHFSKYVYGGSNKISFANLFIEECDDLALAASMHCRLANQGNAQSYRLNFRSYNKAAGGAPVFTNEIIRSQCVNISSLHYTGMNSNFPTSSSAMPFVVSVEMYLGSADCSETQPETKGMYTYVFNQGLGSSTPENKMIYNGGYACTPSDSIMTDVCAEYMGVMSGATCMVDPVISNFTTLANCSSAQSAPTIATTRNIKQMISIPKNVICSVDTTSAVTPADYFPAGNGSTIRPYKICTEWQINQIGEVVTPQAMRLSSYKLLNNLDMNKTDFGPYSKPSCVGVSGSLLGDHHNFNPLDGINSTNCQTVNGASVFSGNFNGNNKTISNARIYAKGVSSLGFIRTIDNGEFKDLNFENLEVRGMNEVGGFVGTIVSGTSNIKVSNIKMNKVDIEGKFDSVAVSGGNSVGSLAGSISYGTSTRIDLIKVTNAKVYGRSIIGGLIGNNGATDLSRSKFSGYVNSSSTVSSSLAGGLVGANLGNITSSLSEGMINSTAYYTGGLAGTNTGSIHDSYSTMYVRGYAPQISSFIGGITAKNYAIGSVSNVFFDGVVKYAGVNAVNIHSIYNGDSSATAVGTCVFTSLGADIDGCSRVTRSSLTNGATFPDDFVWQGAFSASLPRLKWEEEQALRPCLSSLSTTSLASQRNSMGRGLSPINPIVICNPAQFTQTNSMTAGLYYELGNDLNLTDWMEADLIQQFNGILDGKGFSIYGAIIGSSATAVPTAIFKSNTGTIKNLNLYGHSFYSNETTEGTAILTVNNSGTIKNILFEGNDVSGHNNVGTIAAVNTGTIDQIDIKNNYIEGFGKVGGAVGYNSSGVVSRVALNSVIKNRPDDASYYAFGGIVGSNNTGALIDQVVFSGALLLAYNQSGTLPYIGGIAGNNSGTISNALTNNESEIYTLNTDMIGGLVGANAGTVRTSLALGKVLANNGSAIPGGSTFSATVGDMSGNLQNLYFLHNQIGGVIGSAQASTSCSGTEAFFSSLSFMTPGANTADLLIGPYSDNGNNLMNMSPFNYVTANQIPYLGACMSGDNFTFIKGIGPAGLTQAQVALPSTFTGFNLAYPGYLEENVYEYHKSQMYNRAPAMNIPIWVMESGDSHPRLLQVQD